MTHLQNPRLQSGNGDERYTSDDLSRVAQAIDSQVRGLLGYELVWMESRDRTYAEERETRRVQAQDAAKGRRIVTNH